MLFESLATSICQATQNSTQHHRTTKKLLFAQPSHLVPNLHVPNLHALNLPAPNLHAPNLLAHNHLSQDQLNLNPDQHPNDQYINHNQLKTDQFSMTLHQSFIPLDVQLLWTAQAFNTAQPMVLFPKLQYPSHRNKNFSVCH